MMTKATHNHPLVKVHASGCRSPCTYLLPTQSWDCPVLLQHCYVTELGLSCSTATLLC